MKLFCNGFNLFRQLNVNKPVIEVFSQVFKYEVIKKVWINHSYTLLATDTEYLIYREEGVFNLKSLTNIDIALLTSTNDQIIFSDKSGKFFRSCLGNFKNIQDTFNLDSLDSGNSFVNISCGSKLIVAYSSDGTIYKIPQKLQFNRNDIIDIQCGKEHCLLLDRLGNVYSFGAGSHGQLGHGKLDEESEPHLVEGLAGLKISKIAAGGWHSCAISQDGDLYVWGWNSNGQLGLGKEEEDDNFVSVMASPQVIDFDDETRNAVFVACGSRHTIVLLDNKQLFGCGWNKYHQLTKHDQENYYKMSYLHDFSNEEVVSLHCGPWNSAVQCK